MRRWTAAGAVDNRKEGTAGVDNRAGNVRAGWFDARGHPCRGCGRRGRVAAA